MRRSLASASLAVLIAATASADWNAGLAAFKAKDYEKARAEFQQVTETNPDYAGGFYMLGRVLMAQNQNAKALQALKKANSLDPKQASYAAVLANLLLDSNQPQEALKTLHAADPKTLQSDREKEAFLLLESKAELASGNDSAVIERAKQAAQANPKNADAFAMLGTAYSRSGRSTDAFQAYRKAFELSGNADYGANAVAAGMRAAREKRDDKVYQDVASVAKQVYAKKPTAENALTTGEALMGGGSYDEALTWFDRSQLDNALVGYYKGMSNSGKGDLGRAESNLRQALSKRPDDRLRKNIYAALGYVLAAQKRYTEAAQAYGQAGDQAKVAEMQENEKKFENNKKADEEAAKIKKLEKIREEMERLNRGGAPTPPPSDN